jgi:hypothetical protein
MGHTHKLDLNNNGLGAPTFLIFTLEANDLPSTLVFLFFFFSFLHARGDSLPTRLLPRILPPLWCPRKSMGVSFVF